MQTSFKTPLPPILEEIQREMRIVVQEADHIVLMGYSLPPDDVTYRAFLAARIRKNRKDQVRCSVVYKHDGCESRWLYPEDLKRKRDLPKLAITARELFRRRNVRYFSGRIPNVFFAGSAAVVAFQSICISAGINRTGATLPGNGTAVHIERPHLCTWFRLSQVHSPIGT